MTFIRNSPELFSVFQTWKKDDQEYFLDFCTGARGIKILYDSFFKEVMNPEYSRERLAAFLSAVLQRNVKIVRILPNDSTRISDETSLLITDIIVELEDGSLANVEVQKIGYAFPENDVPAIPLTCYCVSINVFVLLRVMSLLTIK